jgi:hypothetical protein
VAENTIFANIQRRIPQESDFTNKRDMNPFPHGETASDLAKMFAQYFFAKIGCWRIITAKSSWQKIGGLQKICKNRVFADYNGEK